MNKLYFLILLFITLRICEAQNLVPNGDFEKYSSCPNNVNQINLALFWFSPQLISIADYFNKCDLTNYTGVPANFAGYQFAHSGVGYAGFIPYSKSSLNLREYLEVRLLNSLIADSCYHFKMYTNLCNTTQYTTDEVSVYFSDTLVTGIKNYLPLPYSPQINNTGGFITNTLNWTLVSGNYKAIGGESYLIIGNFKNDANTKVILINSSAQYNDIYFYIDDVSLTLCSDSNNIYNNSGMNIYPNPFMDKLNVIVNNYEPSEIILYDITSRKIFSQSFTSSILINTEQLAAGVYLYEVINQNKVIKKGKVVKF